MEYTNNKPTFLKDLFDRRFPQILFIYLGICWTILEFISWIVEHCSISPYLTDLSFITLISMTPTVGLLAYFHGRDERRCYRKMGDSGKTKRFLERIIYVLPMFAPAHLELALISVETGDYNNVRKHMEIVNSVWKNAEPEFIPAAEARRFCIQYLQPPL